MVWGLGFRVQGLGFGFLWDSMPINEAGNSYKR